MLVGTLLVRGAKGLLSLSLVLPISPISLRSQQGSTFPSGPSWEMALCGPGWLVGAAYPVAEGARHKPGVAGVRDVCRGRPTGSREKGREVEGLPSGSGTQCSESADSVITTAPQGGFSIPPFHRWRNGGSKGRGFPEGTLSGISGRTQNKYLTTGLSTAIPGFLS